jgi:porin
LIFLIKRFFGDSYKYYFANFNFNLNPITTAFYNPDAFTALGVWTPAKSLALVGGVIDPFTQANNFDTHVFERANLYAATLLSYQVQDLPGKFFPQHSWSNRAQIDRRDPFGILSPASAPNAVGALLGASPTAGLPVNYRTGSWFSIANLSQYLFVKDDPATIDEKLKNGQPLRGFGVFSGSGAGRLKLLRSPGTPAWLCSRGPLWTPGRMTALGSVFFQWRQQRCEEFD